jgi:hypothetical protein
MGSTLCIVDFLSRHERRVFFYFLEDGFVIKCIYRSSYHKLLCDVSSKKNHQKLFLGSFDSLYTENTQKVVVASVIWVEKISVKMLNFNNIKYL